MPRQRNDGPSLELDCSTPELGATTLLLDRALELDAAILELERALLLERTVALLLLERALLLDTAQIRAKSIALMLEGSEQLKNTEALLLGGRLELETRTLALDAVVLALEIG